MFKIRCQKIFGVFVRVPTLFGGRRMVHNTHDKQGGRGRCILPD